jgi:hypothetical protein
LDHLTARQLAINRFAKQHDALSSLLDPWTVPALVAGHKRRRELDDALKVGRNPLHGGFAGAAQEGQLSALACTAVRAQLSELEPGPLANLLATVADSSPQSKSATPKLSLDERRAALLKMRESAETEVLSMEKRQEERIKSIRGAGHAQRDVNSSVKVPA